MAFVVAVLLGGVVWVWWSHVEKSSAVAAGRAVAKSAPARAAVVPATRAISGVRLPVDVVSGSPIEVCGFGMIGDSERLKQAQESIDRGVLAAIEQSQKALLTSGDNRARAAGLLVQELGASWIPGQSAESAREALARLAASGSDPAVYGMALFACSRGDTSREGPCEGISASGWTEIDADNAVPWLLLASQAAARHDAAGEARAFEHAARARSIEGYATSLMSYASSAFPADLTPLVQFGFSGTYMGLAASASWPWHYVFEHCSASTVSRDVQREQCGAIAEQLVTSGSTLLEFAVGVSLGERAGWTAQRVAALRGQKKALTQVSVLDFGGSARAMGCDAVGERTDQLMEMARNGEMAALRGRLERSGVTIDELAEKNDERMTELLEASRKAE